MVFNLYKIKLLFNSNDRFKKIILSVCICFLHFFLTLACGSCKTKDLKLFVNVYLDTLEHNMQEKK